MEIAGLVLGVIGTVFAVVSLGRAVPTFSVGPPTAGQYMVSHNGPGAVVVRRAWGVDLMGNEYPLNVDPFVLTMNDIDGATFPPESAGSFGKGAVMPAHRLYFIAMNVNQSVFIKYRAKGFLGVLSRATLQIEEGP